MNKKHKIFLILGLSLILFLLIAACLVLQQNRKNKVNPQISVSATPLPSIQTHQSSFTSEQVKACWQLIEQNLLGKWSYIGGELEEGQEAYVVLFETGQFTTLGWGGDGVNPTGEWTYSKGKLSFDFADDNPMWINEDAEAIARDYENTTFDETTKTLTVPIGFIQRSEDFTGECDLYYFHIDMLNYFLHKEV